MRGSRFGHVELGDLLCRIEAGKSPMADDTPAGQGEWGVLKVSAIQSGRFVARENKAVRDTALIHPGYEVRPGDLIMTRANTEELVGLACVAVAPPPRLMLSDKTLRLVVDEAVADPTFLALVLAQPSLRQRIRSLATGTSGSMKNIGQGQIRRLPVPDVPLDEQCRIVAAHIAIERRIAAIERVRAKCEVAEAALSAQALSGGTDEWLTRRLESVATVAAGVTLGSEPVGDGVVELPYLRVANVLDGRIDTTEVKTVRILSSQYERYALRAGDLLLTEGGDLDKLGRGAVWDGRLDPCLHQNHVFRVRCGDELSPDFLALYTSSSAGRAYFQSVGKQTTNLASINSTQVKAMSVPVPPRAEQERLLGPVRAVRARNEALGRQIEKLRVVQLGLVEDLLSGRVRVS
ncbi:restriction endonuclease subunit S [Streptomyces sp. NBC_00249]|uniref:restriction endonuclease subunit S n=1 Tax=Streptomyces sp. NBC_00249 TaxID=2975690 RepID=UPI002250EC60|nr:restriction endonuclease subunit S [Streptomyces sp. NBC_00249]MCX5194221.1 restriction endonuclease subunit S [Streptomyces sp. NBC_00249]